LDLPNWRSRRAHCLTREGFAPCPRGAECPGTLETDPRRTTGPSQRSMGSSRLAIARAWSTRSLRICPTPARCRLLPVRLTACRYRIEAPRDLERRRALNLPLLLPLSLPLRSGRPQCALRRCRFVRLGRPSRPEVLAGKACCRRRLLPPVRSSFSGGFERALRLPQVPDRGGPLPQPRCPPAMASPMTPVLALNWATPD
jgi:hypothetical protein